MKRVIHMTAVYSPHQQTGREKLTTKRKKSTKTYMIVEIQERGIVRAPRGSFRVDRYED